MISRKVARTFATGIALGVFVTYQSRIRQDHHFSPSFIADAAEKVMDSVVNITLESDSTNMFKSSKFISSGSGFFINEDGTVLTNAHVVEDLTADSKVFIKTSDGVSYEGYVHSFDAFSDLAIVKPFTKARRFKKVVFGNNKSTRPGDWVIAIGCPFGLQNTVTAGIVSSLLRHSNEIGRKDGRVQYIQTDCVVHSGSSGGPLVNIDGRVIGINTTRAESEGISFAIRVDTAMDMIQMLQDKGRISRPFIGIETKSITPSFYSQLNEQGSHLLPPGTSGVLISKVLPHSPAANGGILEGDIVTRVGNIELTEGDDKIYTTQELLSKIGLSVGKKVELTVRRNLPLDMDWDGRVNRYEVVETVLKIVPEELEDYNSQNI